MKRVVAIVTEYRHDSHAEVIVGRLLGRLDFVPQIKVAALYLDQVPLNDMGKVEAEVCGVAIYSTIGEAISESNSVGGIDGILLIGEHGDYPWNEKRQKLYPRLRFFEETFQALDRLGLKVPIFNDKHLSFRMEEAEWIYQGLASRRLPFLGGSSIPHTPHVPEFSIEKLLEVREIFVISWLGIESYGYHGMEVLQSLAEQRRGGETGIKSVQALEGRSVWAAMDQGVVPEHLMLSALRTVRGELPGHPRDHVDVPVLFIIEYSDGLKGYVLQLQRFVREWAFAFRDAEGRVTSARCESGLDRPYKHFEKLTHCIEQMILSGSSPVPMERTFVTTGLINFGMEALHFGRKMMTPQLAVCYSPKEL
ncbi:hypothetical protein [Paenibacillus phytorum]|nr:hypothetical protein [Paenibacillus phytorum]